jgi:exodeoxyribonuclease VII small subunit
LSDAHLTYREALEELRTIHARLRGEDVDIDTLVEDVKRAADLVAFCRERLTAVGERLEDVLADFDTDTAS